MSLCMTKIKQENLIDEKNIDLKTIANDCIYSTEEIVVGKWLNKPLYRRVILFTVAKQYSEGNYNTYFVRDNAFENIDVLVKNIFKFRRTDNRQAFSSDGDSINCQTSWNGSTVIYANWNKVIPDSAIVGTTAYMILEYTKTTD